MTSENIQAHIEALIFAATQSLSVFEIQECMAKVLAVQLTEGAIEKCIHNISEKCESSEFVYGLVRISGGYQFMTKKAYQPTIAAYLQQKAKKRLSRSAMETLAIIAYKQPATKLEMEQIRGVSCDYSVQKLLEKELIEIQGRSDAPGQPLLYGTSSKFMNYFGLNSVSELPKMRDIEPEGNMIGEADSDGEAVAKKAEEEEEV